MFNFWPWIQSIDTALESMRMKVLLRPLKKLIPNQNQERLMSTLDWRVEFA